MADHQSLSARLKAPSTHSRRLRMLLTVFLVCSIVLGIRLVDLQGVRADDLSESAARVSYPFAIRSKPSGGASWIHRVL